jgi:uncharacterized RDD family membrane protein YckC
MSEGGVSPVPREARRYQGERAGLVTRTLAGAIDGVVVLALVLAMYLGLNALRFVLDPSGFRFSGASLLLTVTFALGTNVLYLAVLWAATGRTYGCHVMGLRVVGRQGRRVRPSVALVRAVMCTFFPIGLLWCVFSRNRSSVQDVVVRTSVIYDWMPAPDRLARPA